MTDELLAANEKLYLLNQKLIAENRKLREALEDLHLCEKAFMRVLKGLEQGISTVPNSGAHEDLKYSKRFWDNRHKALEVKK